MGYIAVTYTFANSTLADATQVNANFQNIIDGLSDATKNLNISALTVGGVASLGAAVTLGTTSVNDITVNGSLASSIAIKTTYSYDIGAATIGLKSIYLGSSDSAARTTRVIGATVASSWTLTLPTGVPSVASSVLVSTTGGVTSWASPPSVQGLSVTASKTSTYTAAVGEYVLCNASGGAFTVNLPTAAGITGQMIVIKRTDSAPTIALTIDGSGSETIDGALTRKMYTQYEQYHLISDGTNWQVVNHIIPQVWVNAGAITITGSTTNPTKGTIGTDILWWRRVGTNMEVRFEFKQTVAGAAGTGDYLFAMPSGHSIDTAALTAFATISGGINTKTQAMNCVGACGVSDTSNNAEASGNVVVYDATRVRLAIVSNPSPAFGFISAGLSGLNWIIAYRASFSVPISGWEP